MPKGVYSRTKPINLSEEEREKRRIRMKYARQFISGEAISKGKKGKLSWRKGISKYNTEEERREDCRIAARRCYQKHLEQRRFYYRQLNCKRRNIGGKHSYKDWLKLKKRFNNTCQICRRKEPEITLTEDHIIPISKWNKWIKEHLEITYQCNDIENIQPLCKVCNIRKFNHICLAKS